jgi:hypothetical protein
MASLWKGLLFVHGHLLHKDDLDWHRDAEAAVAPPESTGTDARTAHSKATTVACCASVWPRIMAPR